MFSLANWPESRVVLPRCGIVLRVTTLATVSIWPNSTVCDPGWLGLVQGSVLMLSKRRNYKSPTITDEKFCIGGGVGQSANQFKPPKLIRNFNQDNPRTRKESKKPKRRESPTFLVVRLSTHTRCSSCSSLSQISFIR